MKALYLLAAVLLTAGAGMVYTPAGVIVAGICCGAAGWLLEDISDGEA